MAFYGARSSTASHYSKDYTKTTSGKAEANFYGIPLNNDISNAPTWQILSLAVFLAVLVMKPSIKRRDISLLFWLSVSGISLLVLKEVTLIPLLTTIIYTRTSYPYLVVIPHCIAANASYRISSGDKESRFQALLFSFFLYGFGGSLVSDVLMGLPATALAHPRIIPCHILGWALVWFSPLDGVFQSYTSPDSFLHYFVVVCEAVDAVTTPMGRIGRGARELQNKTTAPILGGLFAGIGGALVRFLAGKGTSATLETAFYKTLGYCLLFATLAVYRCQYGWLDDPDSNHCQSFNGSDLVRVVIVSAHVLWTLLCDIGICSGHPFDWIGRQIVYGKLGLPKIVSLLQLGPPEDSTINVISDTKKHSKKD